MSLFHIAVALVPLARAVAASPSFTADSATLCQRVESLMPKLVFHAGSTEYSSSQSDYYTGEERELQPGCIFTPTSTSEVSQFIKLVAEGPRTYTADEQFAFRCGGHTFFAGAANIQGGVTVDLRSLDSFALSADHRTASVGGGSVWSETLYPNLQPYNLTVAGGRIDGVGVGGFVTGGGLNFLERRNGFACDNIYGYEVVLGTGEVVYASADSHRDLWIALKGGSNNFGIVTRFDLATYPQGDMLGGYIDFEVNQTILDEHAKAFSNWMNPANFDPLAVIEIDFAWTSGQWVLSDALFYLDPIETPKVYEEFFAIPGQTVNNLEVNSVTWVVNVSSEIVPTTVSRAIQMNYSFRNGNASLYSQLFDTFMESVRPIENVTGLVWDFLMQPYPVTNGTNSLGLTPNVTDLVFVDIGAAYDDASDDDTIFAAVEAIFDQHVKIVQDAGLFKNFTYLNYAGENQDPLGTYGTLDKLRRVSREYDPRGIFQKAAPGGFKLFA
ncbi:oxidoreductase FAD-binding protein [Xylariaceae sp. FL0804]|nr:oxidoreductase FAD-binding protein [Xylariaceae sp. FL0804]